MAINEKATASVELDGQQAENELKELKSKANELRQELKKLRLEKDPGHAAKKREFEELQAKIKAANTSAFDLNATIRNLSGSSLKDLTRAQSILNAELRKNKRDTAEARAEFAAKAKQLQAVKAEIHKLNSEMKGLGSNMSVAGNLSAGLTKGLLGIGAAFASFTALVSGVKGSIQVFNDFEESLANLAAITGLQGNELKWLSDRAKEASVSVSENGIRFKNSAKEIVDAYTMVGSKRPELLANRDALAAVTEEAMILSRAAKIELLPSATALTTVLNQFNEPADQARRIINALGAGSKVGAGNVEYMNAAIEKSGTSANGAHLSVEQLIGTIQAIAPKFAQPAEAGTMLRNVFLKLQQLDDDLNPTIVGWEKALENLGARQYKTTEITKIFGLESFNMVQALIEGREDILKYTQAVTGTSIAIEQASINSDTNAARLETARNKAMLLRMELGEKLAPALTFSVDAFSGLMKILTSIITNWSVFRDIIIGVIAAYAAYNAKSIIAIASTIRFNVVQGVSNSLLAAGTIAKKTAAATTLLFSAAKAQLTGNTVRATAAMRLFNTALVGTPWGAVLAGVTAVVAAMVIYARNKRELSQLEKSNISITNSVNEEYDQQAAKVQRLTQILENGNLPLNERKKALNELKEIMPSYNGYLSKEGELINHNKQAIDDYLVSLKEQIKLKALSDEMERLFVEQRNAQRQVDEARKAMIDYTNSSGMAVLFFKEMLSDMTKGATEGVKTHTSALLTASKNYNQITEALASLQVDFDETAKKIHENTSAFNGNNETIEAAIQLHDIIKGRIELTEKAISDLTIQMRNLALEGIRTGDFSGLQELQPVLAALRLELDNLKADDLIITGIAETGSIESFLDSLTNADEAFLEETSERNKFFFKTWSEQKIESTSETNRRIMEAELDLNSQTAEEKRKRQAQDDADEIEKAKLKAQAIKDVTLASFREITRAVFDMWSMNETARTDQQLTELNNRRDQALKNENLTEEQRQKINDDYRRREAEIKRASFVRQKRASIISAIINTALGITEAIPDPLRMTLAAVIGAAQTAVIAAQPVPQFAKGRYAMVRGASDGRVYNAQLAGAPKTGIYARPALISETGGELIVDAPTTRNLQLNYPEIINGIMAARVPQYADGRYPSSLPAAGSTGLSGSEVLSTLQRLNQSVDQLMIASYEQQTINQGLLQEIRAGIRAKISLFELDRMSSARDQVESDTRF